MIAKLIAISFIMYLSHVEILETVFVELNFLGLYGLALISTMLCVKLYGVVRVFCWVATKSMKSSRYILFVDRVVSPSFLIYAIGIPVLGVDILNGQYLLAIAACILLLQGSTSNVDEYFWKSRGLDLQEICDSGVASNIQFRKLETQVFLLLYILPIFGLIVRGAYM